MSNAISRSRRRSRFVLVRGFRGEPKKLLPGSRRGQLVEVISLDKTARICVPAVDVFDFNPELFGKLKQAFGGGGGEAVESLWTLGKRYTGGHNAT